MTDTNTITRQPSGAGLDYADPTKFKFQIAKLPRVEFNSIQANIPGITLTEITQPTRLMPVRIPGNDLTFDDLSVTFIVDEDLTNYRSVHDWMVGLAQVDSDDKYRELITAGGDRMPRSQQNNSPDAGRPTTATNDGGCWASGGGHYRPWLTHRSMRALPFWWFREPSPSLLRFLIGSRLSAQAAPNISYLRICSAGASGGRGPRSRWGNFE